MNNEMNNFPTLSEFCNSLALLAGLESKLKNEPVDQAFIDKIKMWSAGIFRLVIMGEIKKGKSTFINALLGVENLVPVCSDIATSTIYKIFYGDEISYKVFFKENSGKPSLVISRKDLEKYGTEKGNPNNGENVDFIQVSVPSPILKKGLVIIDTPGLGGLFRQHKRITYEYVPRADAVFMVTDSFESPIGQAELDLLKDLKKVTEQIFFVQTKAATVNSEECKSREKNNKNILRAHGNIPPEKLKYFVVDSHLKHEADKTKDPDDLKDSGFIPVTNFINNEIMPKIRQNIMKNALYVAWPKYEWVKDQIEQAEHICAANTRQQQAALKKELDSAKEELQKWQGNLPQLQGRFREGISQLKNQTQAYLKRLRPDELLSHYRLLSIIDEAPDIHALQEITNDLSDKLPGYFAECKYEAYQKIKEALGQIMSDLANYNIRLNNKLVINDDCPDENDIHVNTECLDRVKQQNMSDDWYSFANLRNCMYGGMAGMAMVHIAGAVIDSVLPGLGTIICSSGASLIAFGFGGREAAKLKKNQELKNAKQQLQINVEKVFNTAYRNVAEDIQRFLNDVENKTCTLLQQAVNSRQKALQENTAKLNARQMISAQSIAEEQQKIGLLKKEFALVSKIIKAVR